MNKKEEQQLMKILEDLTDGLGQTVNTHKGLSDILSKIIGLIESLMRSVAVIFFILNFLIWQIYLSKPFSNALDMVSKKWKSLSESYQILILGFIGAIMAGIIAHIVGAFLVGKIKNILRKK